jgi:hypothetical protein
VRVSFPRGASGKVELGPEASKGPFHSLINKLLNAFERAEKRARGVLQRFPLLKQTNAKGN